jgi:hypothetical protein
MCVVQTNLQLMIGAAAARARGAGSSNSAVNDCSTLAQLILPNIIEKAFCRLRRFCSSLF